MGSVFVFVVSFVSLAETFLLRGRGLTLIVFAEYFVLSSFHSRLRLFYCRFDSLFSTFPILSSFHSRLRLFCCRFDSLFITFPIGDELAMLLTFSVKWSATSPTLYS